MAKRGSGRQSITNHGAQSLTGNTIDDDGGNGGMPMKLIMNKERTRQMLKMVLLTMTPIVLLWSLCIYTLVENVNEKADIVQKMKATRLCQEIGSLVHRLQLERDMSAFTYSELGSMSKSFIVSDFDKTDTALKALSEWPVNLSRNTRKEFTSLLSFKRFIAYQRNLVLTNNSNVKQIINHYTSIISVFQLWLYDAIKESNYENIWKPLVAYQKIVSAKEDMGLERSLGSLYYVNGRFSDAEVHSVFSLVSHSSIHNIKLAQTYSDIVSKITSDYRTIDGRPLAKVIAQFRHDIFLNSRVNRPPSIDKAQRWFDAMSMLIDIMLEDQHQLAAEIEQQLSNIIDGLTVEMVTSITVLVSIVLVCPGIVFAIQSLTGDIQRAAKSLMEETHSLREAKKKADSLLCLLVPKAVGEKLKSCQIVESEYFENVTIFFSDIVGFAWMSSECSPMEIVTMLNTLYTYIDKMVDDFDVYKVETINDSYMIVSGLPVRNGMDHVTIMATFAIHLLKQLPSTNLIFINDRKVNLRIGINTGPVVAGIVGSVLPRYCLFGDTVNTASRMLSLGRCNKIHISDSVRSVLAAKGGFLMKCRGPVSVKGKGSMTTYWLMGRSLDRTSSCEQENEVIPKDTLPTDVVASEVTNDEASTSFSGQSHRRHN